MNKLYFVLSYKILLSISDKDKIINEKKKTIAELRAEIAKLNGEIACLKSKLATSESNLQNFKEEWQSSLKVNQIEISQIMVNIMGKPPLFFVLCSF